MIDLQIDEDPEHIDDTDAEKTPEKNPESSYPADQVPKPSDTAEEQEDDVRLHFLSYLRTVFYLISPGKTLTTDFSILFWNSSLFGLPSQF